MIPCSYLEVFSFLECCLLVFGIYSGRRESSESHDFLELCSYGVHRYFVIGSLTERSGSSQGARGGASKKGVLEAKPPHHFCAVAVGPRPRCQNLVMGDFWTRRPRPWCPARAMGRAFRLGSFETLRENRAGLGHGHFPPPPQDSSC